MIRELILKVLVHLFAKHKGLRLVSHVSYFEFYSYNRRTLLRCNIVSYSRYSDVDFSEWKRIISDIAHPSNLISVTQNIDLENKYGI